MKIRVGRNTVAVVATVIAVAMLVIGTGNSRAQGFPILLQITSPPDGTIVNPGQTINVVVTPTSGDTFNAVLLTGDLPIDQTLATPPYKFSITIPPKATIGKHFLNATGGRSGQQPGTSHPLDLDVEPSVAISKIRVEPATISFRRAGDRIPLTIWGTFADGSKMNITKSSRTMYSAGDPSVAMVNSTGLVTAANRASRGYAVIVIKYGNQTVSVSVSTTEIPPSTP